MAKILNQPKFFEGKGEISRGERMGCRTKSRTVTIDERLLAEEEDNYLKNLRVLRK